MKPFLSRNCCVLAASVTFGLAGCPQSEVVWVPFNVGEGQEIVIAVGSDCDGTEDPLGLTLLSSLGEREVGVASVTPPCGPVGTDHRLLVQVFDEWSDIVRRTSVAIDADPSIDVNGDGDLESRGSQEYDLERDSADPGIYAITLQSQGVPDEVREDVFSIVLWQPEDLEDVGTVEQ